ncbi:MAG: hypothetical protein ACPG5B_08815 [Chitinophagales bacterium]
MSKKIFLLYFSIFLLCFFFSKNNFAQEKETTSIFPSNYNGTMPENYRQMRREEAITNINNLKEGALLVRLKTRSKSLKAYEKAGASYLVKKIKKERDAENQKIVNLFNEYFDFCPIYFFYTDDTERLLSGEHKGIFLDDKLKKDKAIVLDKDFFLIAEFGVLLEEKIWADSAVLAANQNKMYQHQALNKVIVIKDKNLEQLKRPFPLYVRASTTRFWPRKVAKLNKRFHKYFETKKELPEDGGE